ncbi:hypothetical protein GCM10022267_25820 [Lentzea roselyniae]|uniref:Uncharacterized protein n=1 Tax=Lentzea roselyniae TaxID=531940 RepID=A0ABP7AQX7_9PSEU
MTTNASTIRRAAVATLAAVLLAGCEPLPEDGTEPGPVVEFSASCDENDVAFNVEPNTPEAIEAAQEWCTKSGEAIRNAPWPSGLRPVPLGEVQR